MTAEQKKKLVNLTLDVAEKDKRIGKVYDFACVIDFIEQLISEAESRVAHELLADFEKKLKETCEKVRVEAEQKAVERFIEGAKLGIKSTNDLWLEQMSAITEIMSTDKLLEKVTGSLDKLKELSQLRQDDKLENATND